MNYLIADDYATSTENPYVFLWIIAQIVSSSYAYTWDIKMDWGLLDKSAGENTFLREEIVYSSTVKINYSRFKKWNNILFLVLLLFCHYRGLRTTIRLGHILILNGNGLRE